MTPLKLLNFQHILMLSVFTGAGERNEEMIILVVIAVVDMLCFLTVTFS